MDVVHKWLFISKKLPEKMFRRKLFLFALEKNHPDGIVGGSTVKTDNKNIINKRFLWTGAKYSKTHFIFWHF